MSATRSSVSRPRRAALLGGSLALLLTIAACGDDGDGNVVADATKDTALPTQVAPTTLPSAAGKPCVEPVDIPEAEGKPTVEMPVGDPPTELVVKDLTEGDGEEAALGKTIKVHYIGIACSTGMQFDSSWDRGEPTEFPLEVGGLIEGWTEGIPGMKVGGRRQLEIPSALAYGPEGNQGIAPDEALVFVIDLVEVLDAPTPDPADPSATTPPAEGEAPPESAPEGGDTTAPADTTTTSAP